MQRLLPLLLAGCFLATDLVAQPQTQAQSVEANIADLQEQLESGLKARLQAEFDFIKKVCTMVERDDLPLPLVVSTFQWTRKNPAAKKYPFFYFQRALRERAKKLNIDV